MEQVSGSGLCEENEYIRLGIVYLLYSCTSIYSDLSQCVIVQYKL